MKKYEALFMVRPDLGEEQRKTLFQQINDTIAKNNGSVVSSGLWSEKRPLFFPIKKQREAIYYLVEFDLDPLAVVKIKSQYRLNEDILRAMIVKQD